MVLASVGNGSALLPAAYGMAEGLVVFLAGAAVGEALHTTPQRRLAVVRHTLITQNACVALSAVSGVVSLLFGPWSPVNGEPGWEGIPWLVVAGIGCMVVSGCVASVAGLASSLAVEKDWVVIVCGDDEDRLSRMNATMRRIDLFCKTASPVITGALMTAGVAWGALGVAVWNLLSMAVEYRLLEVVSADVAGLSPATPDPKATLAPVSGPKAPATDASIPEPRPEESRRSLWTLMLKPLTTLRQGWGLYRALPFFGSALGLTGLYLSLLSFNKVTSAFLLWGGLSPLGIGAAQAIGAVCGLVATLSFPRCVARCGGIRGTATLAVWLQVLLLVPALTVIPYAMSSQLVAPVASSHGSSVPMWVLLALCGSLAASRVGLWTYDLAVSQMLQSWVHPDSRTILNGVQTSLSSLLTVTSLAFAVAVSNPAAFGWLAIGSIVCVVGSGISHTCFSAGKDAAFVRLPDEDSVDDKGDQTAANDGVAMLTAAAESPGDEAIDTDTIVV
jgi:iron-regulated transporter 1